MRLLLLKRIDITVRKDVLGSAKSRSTTALDEQIPAADEQQHVHGVSAPEQPDADVSEDGPRSPHDARPATNVDGLLKSATTIHAAVANASESETHVKHAFGPGCSKHAVTAVPAATTNDADPLGLHAVTIAVVPPVATATTVADASDAKSHRP